MARRPNLTAKEKQRIARMYAAGARVVDIAEAVGCTVSSVCVWRERLGVERRRNYEGARAAYDEAEFTAMWTRGDRSRDIANHFGRSMEWVRVTVQRLGLSRRPTSVRRIDRDELRRMWLRGVPAAQIAAHFGAQKNSVDRVIRDMDLPRKRRAGVVPPKRDLPIDAPAPRLQTIHVEASLPPSMRTQYRALVGELGLSQREALARLVAAHGVEVRA